jgi:Co/Zn/Cd efflux system component
VLAVNAAMFAVEIGAGLAAGSAALQADASISSAMPRTTR